MILLFLIFMPILWKPREESVFYVHVVFLKRPTVTVLGLKALMFST